MAGPDSILNTRGQSTDTLWGVDSTGRVKLGIGSKSVGLDQDAAYAAAATHSEGDTFVASDGVVVLAGVDSGDVVRRVLVDATGRPLVVVGGPAVDDSAFGVGTDDIMPAGFLADETSPDSVDEGDVGIARMTLDRRQIIADYARASGGAGPYKLVSAATTNAASVKASAGQIYTIIANNQNAAVRYLKLYNKASAPTVGTDVPVMTIALQPVSTQIVKFPKGLAFATGIAIALTTEATDAGSTGVAADEHVINIAYV